jgi:hypothetical protein
VPPHEAPDNTFQAGWGLHQHARDIFLPRLPLTRALVVRPSLASDAADPGPSGRNTSGVSTSRHSLSDTSRLSEVRDAVKTFFDPFPRPCLGAIHRGRSPRLGGVHALGLSEPHRVHVRSGTHGAVRHSWGAGEHPDVNLTNTRVRRTQWRKMNSFPPISVARPFLPLCSGRRSCSTSGGRRRD